jgi:hypothetical protein
MFGCLTSFFTLQHRRIPIRYAARSGRRDLVEMLFPRTKPIPCLSDWSVDEIIETMKYMPLDTQVCKNCFLSLFHLNLYFVCKDDCSFSVVMLL